MNILFNGKKETLKKQLSITQFLKQHQIEHQGIAIAINENIIPKAIWEQTTLQAGDNIEVIMAIQGG